MTGLLYNFSFSLTCTSQNCPAIPVRVGSDRRKFSGGLIRKLKTDPAWIFPHDLIKKVLRIISLSLDRDKCC